VKPEQASKSIMRMPTRPKCGEGRVNGETRSIRRGNGRWKGDAGNRGRPVAGEGSGLDAAKSGGLGGSRTGP
jgi:hypothetical protein